MDLKDCFSVDIEDGGAWFDHPVKPLRIKIALVPQHEMLGIWDDSKKVEFSHDTTESKIRQKTDHLAQMIAMAKRTITDWSGLNKDTLKQLFPKLKVAGDATGDLARTDETVEWLVLLVDQLHSPLLNWIFARATSVEEYDKHKSKEEQANLP